MKKNLHTFFILFLLFCIGCSKDDKGIDVKPEEPDTPVENTSTYVPLDWKKTQIKAMNITTGDVTLTFTDNKVPTIKNGLSLIVLETDTSAYLRRVMHTKIDGNTVVLQTINATMQELFSDTEFTLSIGKSGGQFKSSSGKVYLPTKIVDFYEDGTYKVVYNDKSTKNDYEEIDPTIPIFLYGFNTNNFSLEAEIDDQSSASITTEKFEHSANLIFSAYFKFGPAVNELEISKDFKVNVSELQESSFKAEASFISNTKINISVSKDYSKEGEITLGKKPLKKKVFFMVSTLPVYLDIEIAPILKYEFGIGNGITAGMGYELTANSSAEISYTKEQGYKQICTATKEENVIPFEIRPEGGGYAFLQLSIYPKIKTLLYGSAGPTFEIIPYIENKFYTGLLFPEMYSWSNEINGGLNFKLGLFLEFLGIKKGVEFDPVLNYSTTLYQTPKYIKQVEPANNSEVSLNVPVKVKFKVTGEWTIPFVKNEEVIQRIVPVRFSSNNMKLNKKIVLTDESGNAEVEWTPTEMNDSLVATILDYNGEELSRAVFQPKLQEEEFSIVGSWEGPVGALEVELPEKFKDLEDSYTFYPDGRFEHVFNSAKEIGRGHVGVPVKGYWIGYRYERTKGTYQIKNSLLTTSCTYHYEEVEHDYEFFDGRRDHWSHKSEEGIGSDFIGGKIEIIDSKTFSINKPDGVAYILRKVE